MLLPPISVAFVTSFLFAAQCNAGTANKATAGPSEWPYPEPCTGSCNVHDPSIVRIANGTYFRFGSAPNISLATAPQLSGPWQNISGGAIPTTEDLELGAPDVSNINGTYYMYYQHTKLHTQNSNLSVANSTDLVHWEDQGLLNIPKNANYNRIDPSLLQINNGSELYLSFGSYWEDIFQVRMTDPLHADLSTLDHLEWNDTTKLPKRVRDPSEGSFQFPWTISNTQFYFLFFSSGADGQNSLYKNLVPLGDEYKIMVCRSTSPTGNFTDANGTSCLDGGGTWIYGSQGTVYAPGGQGVMWDEGLARVVMYYHYIDRTLDISNAQFGWNFLDFTADGWPVVVSGACYAAVTQRVLVAFVALLASVIVMA